MVSDCNHRVLCVCADDDELPDSVVARLGQEDVQRRQCDDVYRGLVEACRWQPIVVILGADWLVESELDFVDCLRRACPRTRILVVGRGDRTSAARASTLARAGATPLTCDALHACLASDNTRTADRQPTDPRRSDPVPSDTVSGFALQGDVLEAGSGPATEPTGDSDSSFRGGRSQAVEASECVSGQNVGNAPIDDTDEIDDAAVQDDEWPEDDEESRPVRVPWLRYEGAPQRKPPGGDDEDVAPDAEDDDPPLLSAEELEALLGDGPVD